MTNEIVTPEMKAKIYPIRRSEEARHEIEAGVQDWQERRLTEEETRARFTKARAEWDEQWGGDCPWRKPDPEFEELRRRAGLLPKEDALKRSSVDTFWIPLILIIGFLAFLFGLYYILDLFIFTFLPWWFA